MTREEKETALAQLRELGDWIASSYCPYGVELEADDYYFDLGQFGEHSTSVRLEEPNYDIEVSELFYNAPISLDRYNEIVDELEGETSSEQTLDEVLDRMQASGGEKDRLLASVLWNVVYGMRDAWNGTSTASGNELPPEPLPWPGALRTDIDYTAADFTLRYQPPPGFDWSLSKIHNELRAASYKEAVAVNVSEISESEGLMLIDDRGRIRWRVYADGDYSTGARWLVWGMTRAGIPKGSTAFGPTTPPMALDEWGDVIYEGLPDALEYNFTGEDAATAKAALDVLKEKAQGSNGSPKFEPPKPVSV